MQIVNALMMTGMNEDFLFSILCSQMLKSALQPVQDNQSERASKQVE